MNFEKPTNPLLLCTVAAALLFLAVGISRASASPSLSARHLETFSVAYLAQEAGGEISKGNWRQHPKIKAVRAIVQTVGKAISRKSLAIKKRSFDYCEPYEDVARTLATDAKGRVRYYANEAGSDDSALKWQNYYDEQGNLRFVFITGGAANGSQLEHRIYFDENGKRIWEQQVYTKGPGYTFPDIWPGDQLQIKGPAAKFASMSPCPESKRPVRKRNG